MTGGGFYVVSFVSCSSCFMLKFLGHYVIKLLGVWRAQAPLILVVGAAPTVGQMSVWSVTVTFLVDDPLRFHFGFISHSEAQVPAFVRRQWDFQGGFGPILGSELWTSVLTCSWAIQIWKWLTPLIAVGLEWLWEILLCYGNKMFFESSPFLLLSQRVLPWLFSSHIHGKIMSLSWFESLALFCQG